MSSLRLLWSILSPGRKRGFAVLLALLVISAALESVGLGLILPLIALMTAPETVTSHPRLASFLERVGAPEDPEAFFFVLLGFFNAVFLLTLLYRLWLSWVQTAFLGSLKVEISSGLFDAYMRQPWPFYTRRHSAELIQNTGRELDLVFQYGFGSALILAREVIFMAAVAALLIAVAPLPSLFAIACLIPVAWAFQKLGRLRIKSWAQRRQDVEIARLKCVQDGIGLVKEIRLGGKEGVFTGKFDALSSEASLIECKQSFMRHLSRPVFEFYAILLISVTILVMRSGGAPLAEIAPVLGLFSLAVLKALPSVNQALISLHGLRYVAPTLQSVSADLRLLAPKRAEISQNNLNFRENIQIGNLSYTHEGADREILSEVSLDIRRGEFVAITGRTGSGKSTLIDLFLGLLEPDRGRILVDGFDIRSNVPAWQSRIGYVGQSIVLTDDTIRRNVAFGVPDEKIDDREIWRALEEAQIDCFVRSLPDSLDSVIGERGARLSGGERQRLGIARALYPSPPILVFDEATSALDEASQALVLRTIEGLKGQRTVLMVTHRLETLDFCDKVYRIEDGKVTLVSEASGVNREQRRHSAEENS